MDQITFRKFFVCQENLEGQKIPKFGRERRNISMRGQTNKFLKTMVEKVETYLNWAEPSRTLFLGRESQNIAKFGRES